jgi:hypothetical protein
MMKPILKHILLAALLVCVQVLIIDNLQLRGTMSTFISFSIYYFYIILLPSGISSLYLLLSAFCLGFAVDLFADTLGIHAAACVFTGFARIHLLGVFRSAGRREQPKIRPSIHSMGTLSFLYYVVILSFCFFLALCSLEVFSFHKFYVTILRIILSTITSSLVIMLFQILLVRTKVFK